MGIKDVANYGKFLVGMYKFAKAGGDYNTGELPKTKSAATPKQADAKPATTGWAPKHEANANAGWGSKK